ncbi:uncharacterized protein LOC121377139 [Gigantopelta aegis]|uniref:uncharacterized protein LOC121377139 n=1 Tax=Gigantopelta aegis TaxID=1735272 RepID=UPI001B8894B0|nr:uncharacterized protein LOC121377139 [Gigantopelta aegis]
MLYVTLIVYCVLHLGACDNSVMQSVSYVKNNLCENKVLLARYTYSITPTKNKLRCAFKCSEDENCLSFHFEKSSLNCHLNMQPSTENCVTMATTKDAIHFDKDICLNGGRFVNGQCICTEEYMGETCEQLNIADPRGFKKIVGLSILFYETQRSGYLPASNRIPWRGDSATKDGSDVGLNLTGGWYDAGGTIKFTLPMSATVTRLTWSLITWPDAYEAAGQLDYMFDSIRWPLDYFLRCWIPDSQVFYVQESGYT